MERAPAVAGRFYPDNPDELQEEVLRLLGPEVESAPALGAIVPHGALRVSGALAAAVYARIRVPSVVVLLCASHTGHATRGSIMSHGTWRLPGGGVPIDTRIAEELRSLALLTEDADAHRHEHALEVHLPFLVRRNPRVRIVPVTFGMLQPATCVRIGNALADVMNGHHRDVLVVASTGLSHYLPEELAAAQDERIIERVRAMDVEGLFRVSNPGTEMDGTVPVAILMAAARALGTSSTELVGRSDSAEATGDHDRVVGYAGLIIR